MLYNEVLLFLTALSDFSMKQRSSHNSMNNEQLLGIYCAQHCCKHLRYLLLRTACGGGAEVKQQLGVPASCHTAAVGAMGPVPTLPVSSSSFCVENIHHVEGRVSQLRQVSKKKIHRQFLFLLSSVLTVTIIEEHGIYKNMLRQKISGVFFKPKTQR